MRPLKPRLQRELARHRHLQASNIFSAGLCQVVHFQRNHFARKLFWTSPRLIILEFSSLNCHGFFSVLLWYSARFDAKSSVHFSAFDNQFDFSHLYIYHWSFHNHSGQFAGPSVLWASMVSWMKRTLDRKEWRSWAKIRGKQSSRFPLLARSLMTRGNVSGVHFIDGWNNQVCLQA